MSKFKFMIEIVFDTDDIDIEYNVIQKHLQGDIEEAMRNYNLDYLSVEAIEDWGGNTPIVPDETMKELLKNGVKK